MLSEYVVTNVQYDIPNLPDALFSVTPASLPAFSDVSGSPLESATPGPSVPAGTDPLGEVYFFLLTPGDDANGARLVRLPGSCVAGLQACPAVEQVPLPGLTYANNGATMAWSPDNKKAAFVADVANGPARLFVSAMPAPSWSRWPHSHPSTCPPGPGTATGFPSASRTCRAARIIMWSTRMAAA